jgi:hypothetical protein
VTRKSKRCRRASFSRIVQAFEDAELPYSALSPSSRGAA